MWLSLSLVLLLASLPLECFELPVFVVNVWESSLIGEWNLINAGVDDCTSTLFSMRYNSALIMSRVRLWFEIEIDRSEMRME
jgi:hypothetical protein